MAPVRSIDDPGIGVKGKWVYALLSEAGIVVEDAGEAVLRGIEGPVRLFSVTDR